MEKIKKILEVIKKGLKEFAKPMAITLILIVICGLMFPLLMTGISQVIMPNQANGSLIEVNGQYVGSSLVGQQFKEDHFLWGRPSAVNYNTFYEDENGNLVDEEGNPYNGPSSGSQNLGPTNPDLKDRVEKDIEIFLEKNPTVKKEDIPADLLTASGSGLDPHISVQGAMIQLPRISEASGISVDDLTKIVEDNTKGKFLGIFGEETVNVLGVNLDIAEKMGKLDK